MSLLDTNPVGSESVTRHGHGSQRLTARRTTVVKVMLINTVVKVMLMNMLVKVMLIKEHGSEGNANEHGSEVNANEHGSEGRVGHPSRSRSKLHSLSQNKVGISALSLLIIYIIPYVSFKIE